MIRWILFCLLCGASFGGEQRQFGEGHEKETEAGKDNGCGATAMRQHHSEPSRDQQSGRGRGNPAEDMLKNRILSVL